MLGIIALAGFIGTVATWVSKLSRTLANLEATLKALREVLDELKESNKASHKEFYHLLEDHEKRITQLECWSDGK